ncbi:MAG: methyltransferase domain-containing protein [Actinomycetota bacterium]|nr:methyltransferase domain-containing protein [Actinomycetota bacterium]
MKETGRDRYFAALERELDELVDPQTGMLSEQFSRRIDCPLCGSHDHRQVFVKRGYTFVRCNECRLVFSNPQVDETRAIDRYGSSVSAELWAEVLLSERQLELDRPKFERIADALEPFRGDGRLLDVGCSIGLFLDVAHQRGFDGIGIEFGERALRHARGELGLEVLDVPLADAGFAPASFDVVTVLSVLEHTNDPRAMLREVARVLKPGGALYVIVPNLESLACRVLHEQAATFDGRNHLVYFSPTTLSDALGREGFEPVRVSTHVSSLDPVLAWLAYEEPYGASAVEDDPLVAAAHERRHELERWLEQLQLGYKLHCLARRS